MSAAGQASVGTPGLSAAVGLVPSITGGPSIAASVHGLLSAAGSGSIGFGL